MNPEMVNDDSPLAFNARYGLYNSRIALAASSSATSMWSDASLSDASSQVSDDSSVTSISSDSETCDSECSMKQSFDKTCVSSLRTALKTAPRHQPASIPLELRQNPRRTGPGAHGRPACPPALIRQSDRKVNFVDNLVDSSTQIVEAIWPLSSVVCRSELGSKAVLPLRTFIQETLRRSRTSYSTLQVALYYLILIKPHVPKHDFTMEQPDDHHVNRALQCGRRMFLAALILASKYLQDRNYSARAWSKISGLNTNEINQNEVAFLIAVEWKLHITDGVFKRWTEIVLKNLPPSSPPSPGASASLLSQQADWKQIILMLDPALTNIEGFVQASQPCATKLSDLSALSPRSILNVAHEPRFVATREATDSVSTPKAQPTPMLLEPTPTTVYTPGRAAPPLSLGMLPTPRLTPQTSGFCTPAVGAVSQHSAKFNAMGLAMAQANAAMNNQYLDRLPTSAATSPSGYYHARRSSLANSVSTTSSPESMISDISRSSRSSSISSASSLASATLNSKLGLASRFRAMKPCNERFSMKPSVPSVPEDCVEHCYTSSPESYTGPTGKFEGFENYSRDAASAAARTLQELHQHRSMEDLTSSARVGSKRRRSVSLEDSLQDNVREILNGSDYSPNAAWPKTVIRSSAMAPESSLQTRPSLNGTRKRVCCTSEAAAGFQSASLSVPHGVGLRESSMWRDILN